MSSCIVGLYSSYQAQNEVRSVLIVDIAKQSIMAYIADDWSWVKARRQRKKKKVLAGFARATGDCALTASIHDLAVLPELQGLGLGRKLLAKATNQVMTAKVFSSADILPEAYSAATVNRTYLVKVCSVSMECAVFSIQQ